MRPRCSTPADPPCMPACLVLDLHFITYKHPHDTTPDIATPRYALVVVLVMAPEGSSRVVPAHADCPISRPHCASIRCTCTLLAFHCWAGTVFHGTEASLSRCPRICPPRMPAHLLAHSAVTAQLTSTGAHYRCLQASPPRACCHFVRVHLSSLLSLAPGASSYASLICSYSPASWLIACFSCSPHGRMHKHTPWASLQHAGSPFLLWRLPLVDRHAASHKHAATRCSLVQRSFCPHAAPHHLSQGRNGLRGRGARLHDRHAIGAGGPWRVAVAGLRRTVVIIHRAVAVPLLHACAASDSCSHAWR